MLVCFVCKFALPELLSISVTIFYSKVESRKRSVNTIVPQ